MTSIITQLLTLAIAVFTCSLIDSPFASAQDERASYARVSDSFKKLVDDGIKELSGLKIKNDKLKRLKSLDEEFKRHLAQNRSFSDNYFYYVLAPALQLANLSSRELTRRKCEDTRYTIEYTDQAFAPEKSELLPETKRALDLLEAVCK